MEVTVRLPGTCGELVQGIKAGVNLHITCPIDCYSYVTVQLQQKATGIKTEPNKKKVYQAVKETLLQLNCDLTGIKVTTNSELISAKGMASSTADVVGTIIAVSHLAGIKITPRLIKKIALAVEPTDGSFLSGIAAFDHLQGKLQRQLGYITPIPLLVFDTGGVVDTSEFNSRSGLRKLKEAKEAKLETAYRLVKKGVKADNPDLIGRGSTISARANQAINPKPAVEQLADWTEKNSNLFGINVAHSGTLIGLLVKPEADRNLIKNKVQRHYPQLDHLLTTKIINGGYELIC